MKITSIQHNQFNLKNLKDYKQNSSLTASKNPSNSENYAKLPLTNNYLAFLGGYSLKLDDVYKKLDPSIFPPDIKEGIENTLLNNDKNLTLKDVHQAKYKGVLDCFSLDELKEKYPEFINVKSSFDVEASPESLLGKFQNGETDLFSNDEDLSLQLIKLYWGERLSLNDLYDYIETNSTDNKGINPYYTMTEKLNIPLMNNRYAKVLKLSDKEYNEHFSQVLSEKIKESKERRIQQADGEPVFIPSGKLSEEHKKHISEGLKKYYQNPVNIIEMSKRQEEFWEAHPELKEELSDVLDYAWNKTEEGRVIRKYMSKSVNVKNLNSKLTFKKEMDPYTKNILKDFWQKNGWAKEKWSIAMQKGYKYHSKSAARFLDGKSYSGEKICYTDLPAQISEAAEEYARKTGFDCKKYNLRNLYYGFTNEKKVVDYMEEAQKFLNEFLFEKTNLTADVICDITLNSIISFKDHLEGSSRKLPESLHGKENPKRIEMNERLDYILNKTPVYTINPDGCKVPKSGVNGTDLNSIVFFIMKTALEQDSLDVPEYFQMLLDESFDRLIYNPQYRKTMLKDDKSNNFAHFF